MTPIFKPGGVTHLAIVFLSPAGAPLFFNNLTILKREKSSPHIMTYLLPPRLVVGIIPLRFTKQRPALRVQRVFVEFSTAFRRAFATEQVSHSVHWPESSTLSCFTVSRVICSPGWPRGRRISITPRNDSVLGDNALPFMSQRRPIASNKPASPRRNVHTVSFPDPSCAWFG